MTVDSGSDSYVFKFRLQGKGVYIREYLYQLHQIASEVAQPYSISRLELYKVPTKLRVSRVTRHSDLVGRHDS
jgi:hypothetical protein